MGEDTKPSPGQWAPWISDPDPPMTDPTATERQRRQRLRDKARGIASVRVRAPIEDAEIIRRMAQRMLWESNKNRGRSCPPTMFKLHPALPWPQ
jgi:hypothetical protein